MTRDSRRALVLSVAAIVVLCVIGTVVAARGDDGPRPQFRPAPGGTPLPRRYPTGSSEPSPAEPSPTELVHDVGIGAPCTPVGALGYANDGTVLHCQAQPDGGLVWGPDQAGQG